MRSGLWRTGRIAATLAILITPSGLAAQGDSGLDQARQMAEDFAKGTARSNKGTAFPLPVRTIEAAEPPSAEDEQRLVDEIDMLERARAEAEARRDVLLKEREAAEAAERTAADGTTAKADARRRTADADKLIAAERLKADEATRQAEEAKRKIEEIERRIEAERERADAAVREAEAAKRKVEEAEQRLQAERTKAAEAVRETENRKKAEEERRLADERRQTEERRLVEERERAAEALRVAEERQKAVEENDKKRLAAEFDAEARRLDDALRRVQETRQARMKEREAGTRDGRHEGTATTLPAEATGQDAQARFEEPRATTDVRDASFARPPVPLGDQGVHSGRHVGRHSTRVAVLMVMEIGNRGIRRTNKSADPVLCGERGCYVSTGPESPAELLPVRRALGAGRTLGSRAGACSNSPGCVFRDVDLVAFPAIVQPVDMRFLKHDRRQPQALHETSDCTLDGGRLACSGILGPNYTMWVVPEELAREAGAAELERLVDAGLPELPGRR